MGKLQRANGGIVEKTYPLSKEKTKPKEPEWTLRLEEWGTKKEIDDMEHAYEKKKHYSRK